MLQSIQHVGSGPPTYVYSKNATGASNGFFQVFALESNGYDAKRQKTKENLKELYEKEYGKREVFLWKQR